MSPKKYRMNIEKIVNHVISLKYNALWQIKILKISLLCQNSTVFIMAYILYL